MKTQSEVFLASEGDAWFKRNEAHAHPNIERFATSALIDSFKPRLSKINAVAEIGCGNGSELQRVCAGLAATGRGVDPSAAAVAQGNTRLSESAHDIELSVGTADALPFSDHSIDLLMFGFCLYLVDRSDLFKAMAEAHRVTKVGGYVAIVDFDPLTAHRRRYAHHDGLYSFKQDYAKIFLASGLYSLVEKHSFSHSGDYFVEESDERVALTILYKEKQPYLDWQGDV